MIILYYPTGIVHLRNLSLLKDLMPKARFLVIIEPELRQNAGELLSEIPRTDLIPVSNGKISKEVWNNPIKRLFLCMAYPNRFRLHLVYEARLRGIPVLAVEEVHQLALNRGAVNHYLMPLDQLGVCSEYEKEKFLQLGTTESRLMVTGWPFYDEEALFGRKRTFDMRKQYNLSPSKKICLLVLGTLKQHDIVSLETRTVRKKILDIVFFGLPKEYSLLIKPHPVEKAGGLEELRTLVPQAVILDPHTAIESLVDQADLIINRGNSQVMLLALLRGKPVIIVPAGLETLFHGLLDSRIADSPEKFKRILESPFHDKNQAYSRLLKQHFPYSRTESWERVIRFISQGGDTIAAPDQDSLGLISMMFAFLGDIPMSLNTLHDFPDEKSAHLLKRLYRRKIRSQEFENLLARFPGLTEKWHLQSLYARQLMKGPNKDRSGRTLSLLEGLDGSINPHYFIDDLIRRIELEYLAGNFGSTKGLIGRLSPDYKDLKHFRQAFDRFQFLVQNRKKSSKLLRLRWLLLNLRESYARRYIKDRLGFPG